ncbi:MAG: C40 family peptidase [Syntrophobacteraceae bacterium]
MSSELKKSHSSGMIPYSDLIGKPFADFERGPGAYDCYGLVIEVFHRAGQSFPDYGSLVYTASRQIADKIAGHLADFEPVIKPEVFDLVLMWREHPELIDHMGVVVERGYFLHATAAGVVCSRVDDPNWTGRIVGFYRWKKLGQ